MNDWNPNILFAPSVHEHRIYGDDNACIYAVVDEVDYQWAIQWKWSPKWSKGKRKVYLRRVLHEGTRRDRVQTTLFLHTAITRRAGLVPPTKAHALIDHRDGNGLNCRRDNLRWATPAMNARNRFGSFAAVDFEEMMR